MAHTKEFDLDLDAVNFSKHINDSKSDEEAIIYIRRRDDGHVFVTFSGDDASLVLALLVSFKEVGRLSRLFRIAAHLFSFDKKI